MDKLSFCDVYKHTHNCRCIIGQEQKSRVIIILSIIVSMTFTERAVKIFARSRTYK